MASNNFLKKRQLFESSQYQLTKDVAGFAEWTAEQIKARQLSLAKIAVGVWRFPD